MSKNNGPINADLPRRNFLLKSLALIPMAAAAGSTAFAAEEAKPKNLGVSEHYVPVYFNNDEWAFLLAACERLIPSDELGPGAVAEGVPVYIDKQMELPYGHGGMLYRHGPFVDAAPEFGYQSKLTPRDIYRIGIKDVNNYCATKYGKAFIELTEDQQIAVLSQLEKEEIQLESLSSKGFFSQLLQNTKEGYFADPIHAGNQTLASWQLIGFPGARADFTDWVKKYNKPYPLPPISISSKRSV